MEAHDISGSLEAKRPRRDLLYVLLTAVAVAAYLFAWTLGTHATKGDESRHYRRTVTYFEAPLPDFRLPRDPAYPETGPGTIPYYDAALWHQGLALLWKALGSTSMVVAQAYHLLFFVALSVFTYLAGRELGGRRTGLWSAALVATVPMNLAAATLFYMEIPMLAFMAMAVYFLLRRWPVPLGVALAGAFLLKSQTASVLILPLAVATFVRIGDTWRQRVVRTAIVFATAGILLVPDMLWHMKHFGQPIMFRDNSWYPYPTIIHARLNLLKPPTQSGVPMSIFQPGLAAVMLGLGGLLAILVGLARGVWGSLTLAARSLVQWKREGLGTALEAIVGPRSTFVWVIGLPMLFYLAVFVVLLRGAYDVRYLNPITLFGALALGPLLGRQPILSRAGRNKWPVRILGWCLAVSMAIQVVAGPPAFRYQFRVLPEETKAAFEWIKTHTPEDARFLYLEENLTAMTNRPIIWAAAVPRFILSNASTEEDQMRLLKFLDIMYIAVHPTRRCDTCPVEREATDYPRDWLRSLDERPYMTRIYPEEPLDDTEGHFLIYQIDYTKVPPKWLEQMTLPTLEEVSYK